ncbi:hypothetical protein [Carboxylicivirga marina]|uniref:hypothetical protein n=1 Tax=Carboxylicivirga marina TaxID=2800988 RepID=UPI002592A5D0|nr:hypothetical protein [uncultured Carboxylicivirga sp.]
MKVLNYIFVFIIGALLLTSCEEDVTDVSLIGDGLNIVQFESYSFGLGGLADGSEYAKEIQVKLSGPVLEKVTEDIQITVAPDPSSTAIAGDHYRIEQPTITLSADNNYLGVIDIILMTEGNTPPMDGTPEFEDYESPMLYLNVSDVTGSDVVIPTGKTAKISLNFTPPNPYAGTYSAEITYFHPTAGGSYPNDPYSHEVSDKEFVAVTGRKCETAFAIWHNNKCWITVNSDNSITYIVDDTWSYDVALGDPNDDTKVSHYDPETGVIYLYYHYYGSGGPRIFWEVFTPKF